MAVGLLMQGFSYTEMMAWDDEERGWWYKQTIEYREREKKEYEKAGSKGKVRRPSRGRRR